MFFLKSFNSTRLVAVLRPGPAQPFSPVRGARISGVPLRCLEAHFHYLEPFFFGLQFYAEMKLSILLETKTFASGTSRRVPGGGVRGYDGLAFALRKISVAS